MEFLYEQLRDNGSSISLMGKKLKVGLFVFDDKPTPFKEAAHIVFSTRNLTQSITKITKIPSSTSYDYTFKDNNPALKSNYSERPCLLSTHGLRHGHDHASLNQTLSLLPLTVCTTHATTSFLPLDYVQTMGEYTRTTYNYPIFKVLHRFHDCVLQFPIPPPIGSSEEESSELDYSNNCYQCYNPLSRRRTAYMYRDYLFCCHGCRLRACVTRYWYKKVMKSGEEEQIDFDEDAMDKHAFFTIL